MRTLNLLSGVGVAIVGAWLAVTNLAYAAEFTCRVPWTGKAPCAQPFTVRPQEQVTIEVYSIQYEADGKDVDLPAEFEFVDTSNQSVVGNLTVWSRTTSVWKNVNKETELHVQLRVNVEKNNNINVRGRYTVSK